MKYHMKRRKKLHQIKFWNQSKTEVKKVIQSISKPIRLSETRGNQLNIRVVPDIRLFWLSSKIRFNLHSAGYPDKLLNNTANIVFRTLSLCIKQEWNGDQKCWKIKLKTKKFEIFLSDKGTKILWKKIMIGEEYQVKGTLYYPEYDSRGSIA